MSPPISTQSKFRHEEEEEGARQGCLVCAAGRGRSGVRGSLKGGLEVRGRAEIFRLFVFPRSAYLEVGRPGEPSGDQ